MSYITVSAKKVAASARDIINEIHATRKERDEAKIANAMNIRASFWKFWDTRRKTREEAIKYLDFMKHSYIGWRSIYAWGTLEQAEKLLCLAQNGDPVNINADDAMLLWGK